MEPHVEAWARYCATHTYSLRQTLERAIARQRAVMTAVPHGAPCQVCGGPLQLGYKVMLTTDQPRLYDVGYIHTDPVWCALYAVSPPLDRDVGVLRAGLIAALHDLEIVVTPEMVQKQKAVRLVIAPDQLHGGWRYRVVKDLGTCTRCGATLDNVSPGFALVAGGAPVCRPCLRPNEASAMARGL